MSDRQIKDGSDKLNHDLNSQHLDQEKLQCDNQLIQMGLQTGMQDVRIKPEIPAF